MLEAVDFLPVDLRQLLHSDELPESLRHVDRARDELPGAQRPSILELDTGRPAVFDDDAIDMRSGRKLSAGLDEGLHQAARETDAASDADFVAGLIVKTADQALPSGCAW